MPAPISEKIVGSNAIVRDLNIEVPWNVLLATNKTKIKTPSVKFFEEFMIKYFNNFRMHHQTKQAKPINIQ